MTLENPSWRIKTQVCTFFLQDRCIFADSCNFLHTETEAVHSVEIDTENADDRQRSHSLIPSQVTIHSPSSVRSPTRSPRMASLLSALKEVIGEDLEDLEEDETPGSSCALGAPASSPRDIVGSSPQPGQLLFLAEESSNSEQKIPPDLDSSGDTSDSSEADEQHTIRRSLYPLAQDNEPPVYVHQDAAYLLSPVDMSNLPHLPFTQGDFTQEDLTSSDADQWPILQPMKASPSHSPSLSSTYDFSCTPLEPSTTRDLSLEPSAVDHNQPCSLPGFDTTSDLIEDTAISVDAHTSPTLIEEDEGMTGLDASEDSVVSLGSSSGIVDPVQLEAGEDPAEQELDSLATFKFPKADGHSINLDDTAFAGSTATEWSPTFNSSQAFFEALKSPVSPQSLLANVIQRISSNQRRNFSYRDDVLQIDNDEENATQGTSQSNEDTTELGADAAGGAAPDSIQIEEVEGSRCSSAVSSFSEVTLISSPRSTSDAHPVSENASFPAISSDAPGNDSLQSLYNSYTTFVQPELTTITTTTSPGPSTLSLLEEIASSPSGARSPDLTKTASPKETVPSPSGSRSPDLTKIVYPSSATSFSLPRRLVFTPPPTTRRSRRNLTPSKIAFVPITSPAQRSFNSGSSGSSPMMPLSAKAFGKQRESIASQSPNKESEVSKKVPFGFRHSQSSERSTSSRKPRRRSFSRSRSQAESDASQEALDPPWSPDFSSPPSSASRLRPLRLSSILGSDQSSQSGTQYPLDGNPGNTLGSCCDSLSSSGSVTSDSISQNPLLSSPQQITDPVSTIARKNGDKEERPSNPDRPGHAHSHGATMLPMHSLTSSPVSYQAATPREQRFAELFPPDSPSSSETPGTRVADVAARPLISEIIDKTPTNVKSTLRPSLHNIATPRPTLLFAIASDDVDEVQRVLASGEAGPNDEVGPQSALEFALTNDQLENKLAITKMLLSFGANTNELFSPNCGLESASTALIESLDPATKYYLDLAHAPTTRKSSALLRRSNFHPLTKIRYELIGQDRALEQLFRVLNMHNRNLSVTPIVVLFCGPSGHGKSLLARKFGSLLDVPTHTVNATTLHSTHDLWQAYSVNPEEQPDWTLSEFLINNEGRRCVVVLDDIEKVEENQILWSLLMPWELGRCSPEATTRSIDVRNVIWLGTSNIGQDSVLDYFASRTHPDDLISREEYTDVMKLLRPLLADHLGASLLSRVTAVLPFVPFSTGEKQAIAAEALYTLGGDQLKSMSTKQVESMIFTATSSYLPSEGARSLYRTVSNLLLDDD